jgi:hypothetical protein
VQLGWVVSYPRGVLAEFGLAIPDQTEVRVWDSNARMIRLARGTLRTSEQPARQTQRQTTSTISPRGHHSFDDLVGLGQDRLRDGEAESPGGLQIDHQLECRWLLDREIGWLSAIEGLSGVDACSRF